MRGSSRGASQTASRGSIGRVLDLTASMARVACDVCAFFSRLFIKSYKQVNVQRSRLSILLGYLDTAAVLPSNRQELQDCPPPDDLLPAMFLANL